MCNQILNGHAVPDAGNILQADATDFGVGWIDDVRWAVICPVSGVSGRIEPFHVERLRTMASWERDVEEQSDAVMPLWPLKVGQAEAMDPAKRGGCASRWSNRQDRGRY